MLLSNLPKEMHGDVSPLRSLDAESGNAITVSAQIVPDVDFVPAAGDSINA